MPRLLEPYAGMSVLVVDDNVSNTAFLHALLEQQGLQRVVIENDSRQVMRRMAEVRPDLVLLDLHMPHVDGYELLSQIQAFAGAAFLPVLVLTADTTVDARNRALGQGAQDFLTKPLDAVETCLRIGNLLQTRQLYSTLRYTAERSLERSYPRGEGSTERMSRIQDVLRNRSITSVFQPVVDTQSLDIVGHEALSRFPQAQAYGPDRWFSDAAAVGLGVDLEWLAASIAMQGLDRLPDDTFLAVNLSPAAITHLADEDLFAAWVCPRLVIEVTEHVPIEDYDLIDRGLGRLRELGARLSVDDVGAGYAGFRHLLRLRPDIIKLDISLVAGIHRSRGQRALTRALVSFADEVEAMIIAEGIENQEDLDTLKELQVPWAQGYFLGKPAVLDVTDALKPA